VAYNLYPHTVAGAVGIVQNCFPFLAYIQNVKKPMALVGAIF